MEIPEWALVRRAAFDYYPPLARVKRLVESSLQRHVRVSEAARVAHLHSKYFSTFFHARVGIGFARWQRLVRVQRATEVLSSSDASVKEVATRVGFGSVRALERAFGEFLKITPLQFKVRVRPWCS